jgi:hypothetical protein
MVPQQFEPSFQTTIEAGKAIITWSISLQIKIAQNIFNLVILHLAFLL